MAEAATDAVHQILIKIQESIAALRSEFKSELGTFRQENEAAHERMEALIRKQRRDTAGMLLMMRAVAGDFDERLSKVEERLSTLETKAT